MSRAELDTQAEALPFPVQPSPTISAKPFLKWAGGKSGILKQLFDVFPTVFGTYYEPFLGSGAVFFEIAARYPFRRAVINDINLQLIETYRAIKSNPKGVIEWLEALRDNHSSEQFKEVRAHLSKAEGIKLAAYFIYLNKTCYNGLYRVNSKGHFNVPMGSYENPQLFSESNVLAASRALARTKILNVGYRAATKDAGPNDFVYFDPPYDPISRTASFTAYTKTGFASPEQQDLAAYCGELNERGVNFVLSNSLTENIERLYKGFIIRTLNVRRTISCDGKTRKKVQEVLIMNFDPATRLPRPSI